MKKQRDPTSLTLGLQLDLGPGAARGELEELTGHLRQELLELDVDSVEPFQMRRAPAAAKGLGLAEAGGLVVKLGGSALRKVVEVVRTWLERDANRSAKLVIGGNSIELKGLSAAQQQLLVDAWIEQALHGAAAGKSNG